MIHVPDVEMPADCLTKWLPSAKLRRSVEYMTGARVAPTANTGQVIEMSAIEGAIAHVSEAGPTTAHGDAGAASGHQHTEATDRVIRLGGVLWVGSPDGVS